MASTQDFIEYVCEQVQGTGEIRYRKMFGDYIVYVNDKPVLLVCDDTVFVKELEEVKEVMKEAEVGVPYEGAKEHYLLDIDDIELVKEVVTILEKITPIPKKKNKKK